jgi:hypothetical protein
MNDAPCNVSCGQTYTPALQNFLVSDAWMMKNVDNAKDFIMDTQLFLIITSKEFKRSICW